MVSALDRLPTQLASGQRRKSVWAAVVKRYDAGRSSIQNQRLRQHGNGV
jgi:hypothetical protein